MATTHDFRTGHFFHFAKVKRGTALQHRAITQEYDEPFRFSESRIIRLWPLTTAVVLGKWEDSGLEEDDALRAALWAGDDLDVVDAQGHISPQFERDDF